ncbi:MAG TPA: carotenoid oxygenase family protein [Thermoanaerobaculia bacterium]|nr:carotenoid oxygenase family protein [Thermoanaerobaculia bacterium]
MSRDHAPLLERLFTLEPVEGRFAPVVEGRIPERLAGSYYLNGPARFRRGSLHYRHWLDGDGLVSRLAFEGGRVMATHRYVQSHKLVAEEAAGEALFRTFGTSFRGDRLRRGASLASPVNVSVYRWEGKLLAFGEQGLPWSLDPETLETLGEERFDGRLNEVSPLSAHASFDRETGEMLNFGISYSAQQPALNFYRFRDGALHDRRRVPLPFPCSVHDFGLSPTYAVFYLSPHLLDMSGLLGEGRSVMDCLSWRPELGSVLMVVDRESGQEVASLPFEGRYCLHLGNCCEVGEELWVDLVELDRPVYDQYQVIPDLFTEVLPGRPVRLRLDRRSWALLGRSELSYDRTPDFPAWDPRKACHPLDHTWVLGISHSHQPGRKFFDQLARLCWSEGRAAEVYHARPGCYLGGEPVFLPDPASEEGGWVVCQEIDPARPETQFLLFDAFDFSPGPVARLHLPHAIPAGFHSSWAADDGA